jgi:polysaccharide export outer membrane protein
LGEVKKPGAYRLTPEMSLLDALSQAGGATEDGVPGVVRLIRPGKGEDRELQLEAFLQPGLPANVVLEEGDVLYVPRRSLANVGYVLQKLNPFMSFLFFASAVK